MIRDRAIKPIEQNMARYLEIKHKMFRDLLQFLTLSLQILVDTLAKCEKLNKLTKFSMYKRLIIARYPTAPLNRLIRIAVSPYEDVNIFTTLNEQKLHLRAAFNRTLSGEQCSEDDTGYAQSV